MKLVKLDDVLELIDGSMADLESNYENSKLQEEIKRLPTADAVPVVRCKDCESWGLNAIKKDEKGEVIYGDCLHFCCSTPKWFYCAWGERKENETANTYSIGKVAIPHEVFEQIYEEGKEDAKIN